MQHPQSVRDRSERRLPRQAMRVQIAIIPTDETVALLSVPRACPEPTVTSGDVDS